MVLNYRTTNLRAQARSKCINTRSRFFQELSRNTECSHQLHISYSDDLYLPGLFLYSALHPIYWSIGQFCVPVLGWLVSSLVWCLVCWFWNFLDIIALSGSCLYSWDWVRLWPCTQVCLDCKRTVPCEKNQTYRRKMGILFCLWLVTFSCSLSWLLNGLPPNDRIACNYVVFMGYGLGQCRMFCPYIPSGKRVLTRQQEGMLMVDPVHNTSNACPSCPSWTVWSWSRNYTTYTVTHLRRGPVAQRQDSEHSQRPPKSPVKWTDVSIWFKQRIFWRSRLGLHWGGNSSNLYSKALCKLWLGDQQR